MPAAMILEVVLILGAVQLTLCDREHKVHNIVLYPERYSWCQTTPIKQVVASPGYESVTIDNNVCVGACYSYSIPKTQPAEPGELIGPYCDSCQPIGTRCYHVTLNADSKNTDGQRTVQKRVQIITNCSCMSCDTIENKDCEVLDENTSELPADLFEVLHPYTTDKPILEIKQNPTEDVPELLHFVPPKNGTDLNFNVHNHHERQFHLDTKLVNLLNNIQKHGDDSDFDYDKSLMKQLLELVEGPQHEITDKNLIEFINHVNVHNFDDLELDLTKLKDALTTFKKVQDLTEKHRNFGLGNADEINRDIEKYDLPSNFGIEGSHHDMAHAKGAHIGMGLYPNNHKNSILSNDEKIGHHHLGEPQHVGLDIGHLVKGPHGSLAFSPDIKVEEKLNLESDMIKPNQEGLILSYESHPKTTK